MKELMIHIEKIVRPLKASKKRKLAMREELLGHLRAIYEEEAQQLGEDNSALQAAVKRFGPVEELSADLKASIPWYDGVVLRATKILWMFNPPHTLWSLIFWPTAVSIVFVSLMYGVFALLFSRLGVGLEVFAMCLMYALYLSVFNATLMGIAGATYGVYQHPQSRLLALLYCLGFCSFIAAGRIFLSPPPINLSFDVAYAVLAALSVAVVAYVIGREIHKEEGELARIREWEQLEIF